MASKRMNVLVYSGAGSTLESVRHCLYSLRRLLSPKYAVLTITGEVLLKEPWQPTCALLVFPGGGDLGYCRTLNGHGNRMIRQFVSTGGSYLGLCAGGYYGTSRCEFEVGNAELEVTGRRELEFFPGIGRGSAFKGFKYGSEEGTQAAELKVNKATFANAGAGGVLPELFRAYANGGSVFVDAKDYESRGVEVLASYTEQLDVDGGNGAAAVVYRKVGEGHVVLTGPHPEFSAANLSKKAKGADPSVIDALAEHDRSRKDFFKSCLMKLNLSVNEQDEEPPSLSPIHFSSAGDEIKTVLRAWKEASEVVEAGTYLKGETDTFHIQTPSSTWSMTQLVQTVKDISPDPSSDRDGLQQQESQSALPDLSSIIKNITPHLNEPPDAKETPYFNHQAYFSNLGAYNAHRVPTSIASSSPTAPTTTKPLGQPLLYAETTTSTSTLLEKNPALTASLPTGTTFVATTQLSGRGRGSNVWISPAGSLMFSFLLRHPLSLNATAPVVFLQYLAALAVSIGVRTYDLEGDPIALAFAAADSTTAKRKGRYANVPVRLKWPNDIYALDPSRTSTSASASASKSGLPDPADRNNYTKIGGILVNTSYTSGHYTAIVGIGLNLNNALPTTSLNALVDAMNLSRPAREQLAPFTSEKLLARILSVFEGLYGWFCERGFAGRLQGLYEEQWLHGGQVVVLEEEGGTRARIRGITGDWGLLRVEELRDSGVGFGKEEDRFVGTGREFALQSDSNSFDFFKGLVRRKL